MPTEAEFENDSDAVAGRALLEERLLRLTSEDLKAFWEAVQRCYVSTADDAEAQAA